MLITNIPVSCHEWVVPGDEYTSGERNLPPIDARVFVFMPYGTFDGCFVLCSGLIVTDKNQKTAFMEEDKEKLRKHVTPGNWKTEYDYTTGSYEAISPDKKTSLKIDYGTKEEAKDPPELHLNLFDNIKADVVGDDNVTVSVFDEVKIEHVKEDHVKASAFDEISIEHKKGDSTKISVFDEVTFEHKKGDSCTVKVFDTELTIKKGEVSVKPKKTTIEVDGDATIKTTGKTTVEATGDATVKGANVTVEAKTAATVKAPKVEITGGQLMVKGTVSPATGPFCAIPACLFTGAPHGGNMVAGT
jgi:phage baseplate assembly protein gpV